MNKKYEDLGNSIFEWVYISDNLIESANILRKESYHWSGKFREMPDFRSYRICDVVTMLYAMAIECLLKSLWLLSGNKLIKNGTFVGVNGNTSHHLPSLAKSIEKTGIINFTKKDYKILEELSINITSGRYPVEKNMHKQYQDFSVPIKKYEVAGNILVEKQVKSFDDIKDLLKKLYDLIDPNIEKEFPNYIGKTKRWD
jgi:hypothetical protein